MKTLELFTYTLTWFYVSSMVGWQAMFLVKR